MWNCRTIELNVFTTTKGRSGTIELVSNLMANVYKNIQTIITSSASKDDMYTCPDATTAIIKTIRIYNIHGSSLAVTTTVYDSSSTTNFKYDTTTCLSDNSVDILTFNNVIVLEEADILKMETPTGNKIEMTASVLEISRN